VTSTSDQEGGKAVVRVGGAAIGGFLSTLIGPEAGAAAGQALMETSDWFISFLTQRARGRVEEVSDLTRTELERRLDTGELLRSDGLLELKSDAGAEILEGILRTALEAEGERKCAAIANLTGAIAFEDEISGADALRYLRLLRALSWRQLCALEYFADASRDDQRARISQRGEEGDAQIRPALEAELSEMARTFELIGFRDDRGAVNNPSDTWNGGGIVAATLTKVAPTGLGLTLSRLAGLPRIVTDTEFDELHRELGG
jgi:hypothetical protein